MFCSCYFRLIHFTCYWRQRHRLAFILFLKYTSHGIHFPVLSTWRGKSVWSGWYSLILLITLLFRVKAPAPSVITLAIFFNTNPVISTQFSKVLNKSLPVAVSWKASTHINSSLRLKRGCFPHINTKRCAVHIHWYFNPIQV